MLIKDEITHRTNPDTPFLAAAILTLRRFFIPRLRINFTRIAFPIFTGLLKSLWERIVFGGITKNQSAAGMTYNVEKETRIIFHAAY